jgi:hypothetical protein
MTPPKILARHLMLDAFQKVPRRFNGKIYTTGDFFESIDNERDEGYEITLADNQNIYMSQKDDVRNL